MIRVSRHDRIDCPECQSELKARPEALGQEVTCRYCKATFRAPAVGRPGVTVVDAVPSPAAPATIASGPTPWPPDDCPDCTSSRELADRSREEADQARGEAVRARQEADQAREDAIRTREESVQALEESDRLRELLEQAEADRQELRDRLEAQEGPIAELEALRGELLASKEATAGAEARIEGLAARVGEADRELDRLREDRAELIEERDLVRRQREQDRARAESSARSLRDAHGRWAADRRRWRQEAEALLSRAGADRQELNRRLAEALDATTVADRARTDSETQVARLSEEVARLFEEVARLSEEVARLERERGDQDEQGRPEQSSQSEERDRIAEDRDRIAEDRDRLLGEVDRLATRLAEVESAREVMAADIERLRADRDLPGSGARAEDGAPDLEEQLRQAIDRAESAARERDELALRYEELSRGRSETESSLLSSLDRVTRELDAARVERTRFERTVQYFNSMAKTAGSDRDRLQAELDEARRRLDEALADRQSLQDRLARLAVEGASQPTFAGASSPPPPPSKPAEPAPARRASRDQEDDAREGRREPSGRAGHPDRAGFVDLALADWDRVDPS